MDTCNLEESVLCNRKMTASSIPTTAISSTQPIFPVPLSTYSTTITRSSLLDAIMFHGHDGDERAPKCAY